MTMKALKKNDFLGLVPEEPITRGELVDLMEEYEFIDSWLTFLIDHFKQQGKIEVNDEGKICRKTKKGGTSGPRTIYRVVEVETDGDEPAYEMETTEQKAGEALDKDAGWAVTKKRAVKNATSNIFKNYQAHVAAVKAIPVEDEGEDSEAEAA